MTFCRRRKNNDSKLKKEFLLWGKQLSCQDMPQALKLSNRWGFLEFRQFLLNHTYSLVQAYSTLRMFRPKSKSKPKSSQGLSARYKTGPCLDYSPELFVVLQPNVLIVPWPLRSPRKFKLTFSITLLGLQSSFSHWQTNEKKVKKGRIQPEPDSTSDWRSS